MKTEAQRKRPREKNPEKKTQTSETQATISLRHPRKPKDDKRVTRASKAKESHKSNSKSNSKSNR